jgi:hypothetical protein
MKRKEKHHRRNSRGKEASTVVFTLKGRQCQLSKEDIEKAMNGLEPAKGRHYFVVVNGQRYPAEQVLYVSVKSQCTDLPQLDVSSSGAANILSQISFEVVVEK